MRLTASGAETEPLCPLCQCATARIRYAYADYKIVSCENCALWRTCPRLSAAQLDAYYQQMHYSDELKEKGNYDSWRASNADVWSSNARMVRDQALARGLGAGKPLALLDVGAGHGFFLDECRKLGINGKGIETSPHAVKYACEDLKLDVRRMPLDSLPAEERYDVIALIQVLEHVPDPLLTARQVLAHLNPGGMAWFLTPNTGGLDATLKGAKWFNFLNKSHLTHFHRTTLQALLAQAGFKTVRRHVAWGGGGKHGIAALAQYAGRLACLGTELRFVAEA